MIKRIVKWLFAATEKPIVETNDIYDKLVELENRILALEHENVENSNCFYELSNSIDAVDARIDILLHQKWNQEDV